MLVGASHWSRVGEIIGDTLDASTKAMLEASAQATQETTSALETESYPWLDASTDKPDPTEWFIRDTGPSVWRIVGQFAVELELDSPRGYQKLLALENIEPKVMKTVATYYDVPIEAVQDSMKYARLHPEAIIARLVADRSAFADRTPAQVALFLTDESVSIHLAELLKQQGHDAVTARELGLAGKKTPDHLIIAVAIKQGRILITENLKDFLPLHDFLHFLAEVGHIQNGPNGIHPGILAIPQVKAEFTKLTADEIVRFIKLHATIGDELHEWISGHHWRPYPARTLPYL